MGLIEIDKPPSGGNVEVLEIDSAARKIVVRPERRAGGSPHRGWFHFKLHGLEPGALHALHVIEHCWAGVYVWKDGALDWQHFLDFQKTGEEAYAFSFVPRSAHAEVAMMQPYGAAELERLLDFAARSSGVRVSAFWRSESGREGRRIHLPPSGAAARSIWVTARMHAFESVASWVAEGFVRWALSEDRSAMALRETSDIHVLPMVDIDAVAEGDSGKHRPPIDFARDAGKHPHWNAMKSLCADFDRHPPDVYLDLHGPGGRETDVYLYAPTKGDGRRPHDRNLERFRGLLVPHVPKVMRYDQRVFHVPNGVDDMGQHYRGAAYQYLMDTYGDRVQLAVMIETPWSVPGRGREAFIECGAAYGRALHDLLAGD